METIRKYGDGPFRVGLLHGGPGASGEMKPVARELSKHCGVLEFLQTASTVNGQLKELHEQLYSSAEIPAVLIGYSWGAWLGFLFASEYPDRVKKLILVGSGAFESRYNKDLMSVRLARLNQSNRNEAKCILSKINSGNTSDELLKQFGRLMTRADSFEHLPEAEDQESLNMQIFQSVWREASELRETGQLIQRAESIRCPVVAIHGDYDPHPIEGVEIPLKRKLKDFKMIKLTRCGHTPWREIHAKDVFFETLKKEIN